MYIYEEGIDGKSLPVTMGCSYRCDDKRVQRDSLKAPCYVLHWFALRVEFPHHSVLQSKQSMSCFVLFSVWGEYCEIICEKTSFDGEGTMREVQGMVRWSSWNSWVRPISVTTQLSLSPSIKVRSKSNTTTTATFPISSRPAGDGEVPACVYRRFLLSLRFRSGAAKTRSAVATVL